MKKVLAILLALTLGLVMAACSATPAEPANTTDDTTTTPDVNDTSWVYILQNEKLIIGLDDTFAPMGFRDEAGNLVGFDIDFAKAVCAKLGVAPEFQPINWDTKELELDGKKIDCIWNGLSITPERQEKMSLTKPYLNNKIIIMTNEGVAIATKDDLKNVKIGTQAASSALDVIKADPIYANISANISEYKTYDDCILDMNAGRIDCMVVDEVLGMYKNSKLEKPFGVSEVNFGEDLYAVGLRKGDVALTAKIQEAIDAVIAEGKAAEISNTWFGQDIVIK